MLSCSQYGNDAFLSSSQAPIQYIRFQPIRTQILHIGAQQIAHALIPIKSSEDDLQQIPSETVGHGTLDRNANETTVLTVWSYAT